MKFYKLMLAVLGILSGVSIASAQKIMVESNLVVGTPGDGHDMLTFNSERPWVFRQLGTGPSTNLELYSTVGLKNFIVTTTGNMAVDVAFPTEKLHVNGNIRANGPRIAFGSSEYFSDAGAFSIECNGTFQSTLDNTDLLGTSSRRWSAVYAVNGTINTSDATTKANVQNISHGLNDILKLRPVSFQWIDRPQEGNKLGLIAQEVQEVISEVVVDHEFTRDEQTGQLVRHPAKLLGIYYSDLIPVLIKGMQEQQQLIVDKQSRIAELESKIEDLETRMQKLEQLLTVTTTK